MTPRTLTAESYRFAAAAHRSEAENRRRSPLAFQRAFAGVLNTWATAADARADSLDAAGQPDLFSELEKR
jgi:hypothetical protein